MLNFLHNADTLTFNKFDLILCKFSLALDKVDTFSGNLDVDII